MPTVFSHAIAASALRQFVPRRTLPRGLLLWTVVCAMLPDADVIGFSFGVGYGSLWGHRGLSHSLAAAVVVGLVVARLCRRSTLAGTIGEDRPIGYWPLAVYFATVTASHGVLDALTNGGLGIAFFAPFSTRRFFFPWTPIEVSPIGLRFVSGRGLDVIASEIVWIWLPAAVIGGAARALAARPAAAETPRPPSDR